MLSLHHDSIRGFFILSGKLCPGNFFIFVQHDVQDFTIGLLHPIGCQEAYVADTFISRIGDESIRTLYADTV